MKQTWNLDSIFPGGSASLQAEVALVDLEKTLPRASSELTLLEMPNITGWMDWLGLYQGLLGQLEQLESYYSCCMAADVKDNIAKQKYGRIRQCTASFEHMENELAAQLAVLSAEHWQVLVEQIAPELRFPLTEKRRLQQQKMGTAKERVVTSLSVDGFHGWSQIYDTLVGRLEVQTTISESGDPVSLSMGQTENYFSNGSAGVRKQVFRDYEAAWRGEQDVFAEVLNRIAGFRLAVYDERKWDSHLDEALQMNRMNRTTLEAMWDGVKAAKPKLLPYLIRKKQLLGLDSLDWVDQDAPLSSKELAIPYDDACQLIIDQFGHFSPTMADFARKALKNRWIESENRAGKMPGGFCTGFPVSGESRIFMTYGGTYPSVSTMAHELGHAFHSHQLWALPALRQQYAMNVAETASTFAELLLSDAALAAADSGQARRNLLDQRLQQAVALLMNIHSRFLFEDRFYSRRRQGSLLADELSVLMVEAQQEAYLGSLDSYHSLFWASKLHFFLTDVPFYNFPYTFGYLFSAGLYNHLRNDQTASERYVGLLRDTGSMDVELLADKHLGVDLQQPEFWQQACDHLLNDVDAFLEESVT